MKQPSPEDPIKIPSVQENKKDPDNNYDNHAYEYVELSKMDPSKKWVQYPESLRMVQEQMGGELKGKRILDIGCANGTFSRMMAREGAEVVGYDPSVKEVAEAQKKETEENLGIKYFVSDRPNMNSENKFDATTAILVLSLMENEQQLEEIFKYASESLKTGGKFIILTINPEFKRFDEVVYNRRFQKTGEEKKFILDFFDNNGNFKFNIKGAQFSKSDHEKAALRAGFKGIDWKKMKVSREGRNEMGEKFWEDFETEESCPYIGLVAYK